MRKPPVPKPARARRGEKVVPPATKRLPGHERQRMIVDEAIRFFAEFGFEGQTRALAKRLGVTQPLLYRYFPDKESLVERVYEEVYLRRWNPGWEHLLRDRSRPLHERLCVFYEEYANAIFSYEWVRIFMFGGLRGVNINKRYLSIIREHVLLPVCRELRLTAGLDEASPPVSEAELECAWALHGGIFYIAIRRWVYGLPAVHPIEATIANQVTAFLEGAPEAIRRIVEPAE
ncbi:MAG: TetR/AcrR family transcriptional regulator [Lautropia sp.]|nr:MAG: TetR/AcrR family transcriptional regulator [Pseudomonadota bacterium]MBC6958965.1 TetR/AcrR family transcriptional regulator [Lautropia sp.]MCL4701113.1 TetR/AcrR family transcriptional regulator [Burkholderiaceae bacterium]MCZ2414286.1 TetR/AcrR family transcriptional regulator [Burkholderiales bacterium]MDL1908702.1 TetR/AcrR family transcriptional regulator [Betaproteobacteria bacterium PRO1]